MPSIDLFDERSMYAGLHFFYYYYYCHHCYDYFQFHWPEKYWMMILFEYPFVS